MAAVRNAIASLPGPLAEAHRELFARQVVQSLGDVGVFPSDARAIFGFLGSADKRLELVKGAHYFEDSPRERTAVADLMTAWIGARN